MLIARYGAEPALDALEWLDGLVERHYWTALALYTGLFTLLVLTTLPVGTVFCLAGGFLFGLSAGASAGLLAATGGALLTVLLVRGLGGGHLRERLSQGQIEAWLKLLERDATWFLILLRLIPVVPFFLVNAAAGLTRIPLLQFGLATLVGLAPTTLIYAAIGRGLDSVSQARELAGPHILLDPQLAIPLLALAALILISWFIHHRLQRHQA